MLGVFFSLISLFVKTSFFLNSSCALFSRLILGLLPENSAPTEESASSASINLDDDGGNGYDGSVNAAASDDDDDDGTYKDDDDSSSSGGAASDSNGYSGSSRSGDKYGDLSKGLAGGFLSDFWVFRKRPLSRGWGSSYDFAVDITLGRPLQMLDQFLLN